MKKIVLLLSGLGLMLNGCGGDGGLLTAPGGSVSESQAALLFSKAEVQDAIASLVPSSNPDSPLRNTPPVPLMDEFSACTKKNPTAVEDNDNDDVPKFVEVKYNCYGVPSHGGFVTRVGTYTVRDLKDEAGNENKGWGGGFRYDIDFANEYKQTHEVFAYTQKGFFEVVKTANSMSYKSAFSEDLEGENKTPVYFKWGWTWQSQWENTYKPEDMAEPYKKGEAKFDGFFAIKGNIPDSGKGHEISVVFALKSNGLKYDRSCGVYYREGSISFSDGSGNSVKYVYDCNVMTGYYNGKESTEITGAWRR